MALFLRLSPRRRRDAQGKEIAIYTSEGAFVEPLRKILHAQSKAGAPVAMSADAAGAAW